MAQSWQSATTWGGVLNESVEALAALPGGDGVFVGGTFAGQLDLRGQTLSALGEEDILIVTHLPGRGLIPVLHAGGPGQDLLSGMGFSPSGHFYCGGTFWQRIAFPGAELVSRRNPKAIFVARFAPGGSLAGVLEWTQTIEGGSIKELTAIQGAQDGSLYLGGYFSDTIYIDTLALASAGRTSAFLLKLDSQGKVLWGRRFGGRDDTRIMALTLSAGDAPVVAGIYNDQAVFGDTTLVANTRDWDIFLASLTAEGALSWVRKAGGVYDDEAYSLAADAAGGLYLTGQFLGVMDLGSGVRIESQDGNADAFLLKYRADGTPLWGKVLGGDMLQIGEQLSIHGNRLALTGYFQQNIRMDAVRISGSSVFNGFLALTDTSGMGLGLIPMPGSRPVFPTSVISDGNTGWWVGGVYQGTPQWGGIPLPTPVGGFDAFAAHWGSGVTGIRQPEWSSGVLVYPNPAGDWLQVELPQGLRAAVSLWDLSGRQVVSPQSTGLLQTAHLPAGLYVLRVLYDGETFHVKIVKSN